MVLSRVGDIVFGDVIHIRDWDPALEVTVVVSRLEVVEFVDFEPTRQLLLRDQRRKVVIGEERVGGDQQEPPFVEGELVLGTVLDQVAHQDCFVQDLFVDGGQVLCYA